MNSFEPELILSHTDRAQVVATTVTPGWKIIYRIMRSEADKFILAGINADEAKESEVLAAHRMAKAAAQWLTGLTGRINEEITQYTSAPRPDAEPEDATEGLIDLGEAATNLPNILGGELSE